MALATEPEEGGTTGRTPTEAEGQAAQGAWTGPALSTWGSQVQIFQACYTAKTGVPRRLFKTSERLTYLLKVPLSLSALPED